MKIVTREIKHKYPGSWLYTKRILEWMFRPELRSQLPFLYRVFGFCAQLYFWLTNSDYFKSGRRLFLSIVAVQKKITRSSYAELTLPSYRICVDLTDPRFLNVVNEFLKDKTDTRILEGLLDKGDTFIDIGANHGSFAVIASRILGENGLVVAVEAQPRLVHVIDRSLENNALCPYNVVHTAVGNYDGDIEFMIPKDSSGSAGVFSAHSNSHQSRKIKMQIRRFDTLIDWKAFPGNVVLKLDIEGSEFNFLEGAREMLKTLKPIVIMEINPKSLKASGIERDVLIGLLQDLGYASFALADSPQEMLILGKLNTNRFANIILYPG